ncbi:MAG: hypothetical protein LBF51_01735 [Zoogloeaceae bacterium]|nr:hypothetical protein [Zoogloeaceae bacterium]
MPAQAASPARDDPGGAPSPGEAAPVPAPASIQTSAPAQTPGAARAAAIHKLREAAYYFRTCEPHSPVALLVERAAKWAEMPLETWLHTVIKDESVLAQLRELLDIQSQEVITHV